MRKIQSTTDYADLIEEHKYTENLLSMQSLAEPLSRYYELRLIEIENEIQRYNELLSEENQLREPPCKHQSFYE